MRRHKRRRYLFWAAVCGLFVEFAWWVLCRDPHSWVPMRETAGEAWTGGGDVL